jgi:multidrug efflux system membrane fusion protein
MKLYLRIFIAAFLFLLFIIPCLTVIAAGPPPGAQMPPPAVTVETVTETNETVWSEYSGRLDAVDYVELKPQVSGTIKEIRFEDGQLVKKGDILYVIDPAPYEAAAASAQADLAAAQSRSDLAQKELERAQGLMASNAVSKALLDQRENESKVAKNAAAAAQARLKQAKIDLDYAYVKAPISGRVGRAEITKGNLVQSGPNAPLLTTIVANDEIYADFDVDEETYLHNARNGGIDQGVEAERTIPVKLTVKGASEVVYNGTIDSFDNHLNVATGTIRARALFKNEDGALLPGMFVTVKLGSLGDEKKILISERAIGTDQDRQFVYVVGDGNKVEYREVKLGASASGRRLVLEGLQPGEKIITDGTTFVRPDIVVAPKEETPPPAAEQSATEQPATEQPAAEETSEPAPDPGILKKVPENKVTE